MVHTRTASTARAGSASSKEIEGAARKSGDSMGAQHTDDQGKSVRKKGSPFAWLIPLMLLLTTAMGLSVYYVYEDKVNKDVNQLQMQAQKKALEGKYEESIKLLDTALTKRPDHYGILLDRGIAAEANELEEQLAQARSSLKAKKITAAEKKLGELSKKLKSRSEPLFKPLKNDLSSSQVTLSVMKVKAELDQLATVPKLAEKLETINKLKGKEAAELEKQIISKIIEVSLSDAAERLKSNDFSGATLAVEGGLAYAKEDKRLIEQKDRILQEQAAFERAEAKRIEIARQKAAEEDLVNRTAAVEVVHMNTVLDDYGDLRVEGQVRNVATRPISSVLIELSVYNLDGSFLGSGTIDVSPYVLERGQSGEFRSVLYGAYTEGQAVVDNITWYVE
ncbi:FxLYD domain-containing protein [Paenibacillus sp. N3/727]|uniref:FxLYD domain-containing protein n=1 Tax=Paenibacillus sp. N3/727 TaxID=2925845 RepID=UPI001F52D17C|nr:FxLYD domain-containing protein [Paenibacillus sp. N3/727]UNK19030.1 FxLYD domain-containing protein [Paenibacillus sp. N3/727]